MDARIANSEDPDLKKLSDLGLRWLSMLSRQATSCRNFRTSNQESCNFPSPQFLSMVILLRARRN